MKKTILILLTYFAATNTYGQLIKGTFMPGLSINYNYSKNDRQDVTNDAYTNSTIKRNNIYSNINLGYFVKDNLAMGILTGYQRTTYNNNNFSSNNSNTYNSTSNSNQIINYFFIGIFARYYKMINNSKFGIFIQANSQYQNGNETTTNNNTTTNYTSTSQTSELTSQKSNTFSVGISPGIVYFINKKIGIETRFGNIGYGISNTKPLSNSKRSISEHNEGFDANFSSSTLQLGVNFYLGRKSKS